MYKFGIIFLKPEPVVLIFSLHLGGVELWRGLSLGHAKDSATEYVRVTGRRDQGPQVAR